MRANLAALVVSTVALSGCGGKVLIHDDTDSGASRARERPDAASSLPGTTPTATTVAPPATAPSTPPPPAVQPPMPTTSPTLPTVPPPAVMPPPIGAPDASIYTAPFGSCPAPVIHPSSDDPLHGTIEGWVESSGRLAFSRMGVHVPSAGASEGLADWSVAMLSGDSSAGSAYFYASSFTPATETLVAPAPSVADIGQITDKALLAFGKDTTPIVLAGEFAVFFNVREKLYLALRVDRVTGREKLPPRCYSLARGDFTYFIDASGTGNFARFSGL